MNQAQIKKERTESILKEIIPEAISQLNDERVHGIGVVEVVCSKGRSDAKVYLDPAFILDEEKPIIVKQLNKARYTIENHCKMEQGWYNCPNLSFEFDTQLEHVNKMDNLFAKIEKELQK